MNCLKPFFTKGDLIRYNYFTNIYISLLKQVFYVDKTFVFQFQYHQNKCLFHFFKYAFRNVHIFLNFALSLSPHSY